MKLTAPPLWSAGLKVKLARIIDHPVVGRLASGEVFTLTDPRPASHLVEVEDSGGYRFFVRRTDLREVR